MNAESGNEHAIESPPARADERLDRRAQRGRLRSGWKMPRIEPDHHVKTWVEPVQPLDKRDHPPLFSRSAQSKDTDTPTKAEHLRGKFIRLPGDFHGILRRPRVRPPQRRPVHKAPPIGSRKASTLPIVRCLKRRVAAMFVCG